MFPWSHGALHPGDVSSMEKLKMNIFDNLSLVFTVYN